MQAQTQRARRKQAGDSRKGKRLSEAEKLIIAAERIGKKKTTRQIAAEYGVSNATVTAIEHNEAINSKLRQADQVKKGLSADCYILADKALKRTSESIEQAGPYQAAMIAATMIDKARLIEGQSTVNVGLFAVILDACKDYDTTTGQPHDGGEKVIDIN